MDFHYGYNYDDMYPDFVPEAVDYVVGAAPAGEDPEQYDDIAAFHAGFLAGTVTNSGPADNLTALNKETVGDGVVEQVGEATGIQTMGNGSSSGSGSSSSSENNFTTHPFSTIYSEQDAWQECPVYKLGDGRIQIIGYKNARNVYMLIRYELEEISSKEFNDLTFIQIVKNSTKISEKSGPKDKFTYNKWVLDGGGCFYGDWKLMYDDNPYWKCNGVDNLSILSGSTNKSRSVRPVERDYDKMRISMFDNPGIEYNAGSAFYNAEFYTYVVRITEESYEIIGFLNWKMNEQSRGKIRLTTIKSGRPGDSVNSGSGMKTAKALLEEAIKNALFYNRTYGHDPNK